MQSLPGLDEINFEEYVRNVGIPEADKEKGVFQ